jgi:hypothetical protein
MSAYYTYTIGTKKDKDVYLLAELKEQRVWTKNPNNAMVFFSEEEVQYVIRKFAIPNAAVARIKHKS